MISSFAAYLLLVSVLFAGGGWATEQAFFVRRWPRRFLWLAILLASVLFPLGMALSTAPTHMAVRTRPPAPLAYFPSRKLETPNLLKMSQIFNPSCGKFLFLTEQMDFPV
jgi:hypothetical protein